MVGDSTFFHSGITGLLDIVYNRGAAVIIVLDNRTTAMTGHQEHPGTGRTLMGETTPPASIEAFARACGVRRVVTLNPYEIAATRAALREALEAKEPTVIISQAACPLRTRKRVGAVRAVAPDRCTECGACFKLGCPAIGRDAAGRTEISASLCNGCGLCQQVCKFNAIGPAAPDGAGENNFAGY